MVMVVNGSAEEACMMVVAYINHKRSLLWKTVFKEVTGVQSS